MNPESNAKSGRYDETAGGRKTYWNTEQGDNNFAKLESGDESVCDPREIYLVVTANGGLDATLYIDVFATEFEETLGLGNYLVIALKMTVLPILITLI